jgi:hypothetical protein
MWEFNEYSWYESSAKGSILAEIFLLLIASYYHGRTVHFAAKHRYYLAGRLHGTYARSTRVMYAGALVSLLFLSCAVIYLIWLLVPDVDVYPNQPDWIVPLTAS